FGASQDETVNPGDPALRFTTGSQRLATGQISATMTVQLQDQFGNVILAGPGGVPLTLSTTSPGGSFLSDAGQPLAPASVVTAQGTSTASFRYRDSRVGSPTVRAAGPTFAATQQETITASATLAFTSANAAVFLPGQGNSFTITTAGNPLAAIGASGTMPNGVGFVAHA